MDINAVLCSGCPSSNAIVPSHWYSQEQQNINIKTLRSTEAPLSVQMNQVHQSILFSTREIRRLHEEDGTNSWREYYNDATEVWKGVPFAWESRPGVPKQDLLKTENESEVIYPLSLPPRLRTMCSFQTGSTNSSKKSFLKKMRGLLSSPTHGWLRKSQKPPYFFSCFSHR